MDYENMELHEIRGAEKRAVGSAEPNYPTAI